MESIISAGTYKGELQRDWELPRTKGERKLKTESECKRVGGITLSLLPNLASESSTAGRGRGRGLWVRLTYPASGCRKLRVDWAAEGLDLTSSNTRSVFISIHVFSFFTKALSLYTGLPPTKVPVLSLSRS